MTSINYIIATSPAATKARYRDKYANFALHYHLKVLNKLLETNTHVRQVTIVKQESCVAADLKNQYYDVEDLISKIKSKNVEVKILEVPKIGISYTQYREAYLNFPNYDYYLIMEDDWTINVKYKNFDLVLIDLYKKVFLDNCGFLDAYSTSASHLNTKHGFHSEISLGLLSKKTFEVFINSNFNVEGGQLDFSKSLLEKNVKIIDLPTASLNNKILFWETQLNMILDYSNNLYELEEPFYTPVQYYYKNVDIKNVITKNIVQIDNKIDFLNQALPSHPFPR